MTLNKFSRANKIKNAKLLKTLEVWETKLSDEEKLELEQTRARVIASLNSQNLLMNPKTGTVQADKFWQQEKKESFVESELIPVKLVNDEWVRAN
jgi:hypothetical protein